MEWLIHGRSGRGDPDWRNRSRARCPVMSPYVMLFYAVMRRPPRCRAEERQLLSSDQFRSKSVIAFLSTSIRYAADGSVYTL